jgi:hypothetical protein
MRRAAPLVGAAIATAIGVGLTIVGVDYARNGCDCDEPWYPDWIWIVMLVMATAFYALALALIVRMVVRRHPLTRDP